MKELFKDKDKEKKKVSKKVKPILFLIVGILTLLLVRFRYDLDWIWSIGIAIGLMGIVFMIDYFKKEDKEKKEKEKQTKELVKTIETKTLRKTIKEQRKFIKIAEKEYGKRKDKSIKDIFLNGIYDLLDYSIIVLIFGIFMLGAIPNYFNVNDEFINPTLNMSANESLELITYTPIKAFHDVGASQPQFFFWFFWLTVFMAFIYPIINIVIDLFRKYSKGGKK